MRLFLKGLLIIIFIQPVFISGAQDRCGTVFYEQYLQQKYQSRPNKKVFEQWLSEKKRITQFKNQVLGMLEVEEDIYVIPVVVHVIHNGEEIGEGVNISDEQIFSQIDVLNEDYRRLNSDTVNTPEMFAQVAVDVGVEFRLALRDPDGNSTDGIVRVRGQKDYWTLTADDALLKSQSLWPPEDYFNIWVCKTNYLGYAQFPITDLPGAIGPFDRETDGVVISYSAFGSSEKGNFPALQSRYDRGRTATHEIGHFLSLRHIWGDETNCIADDYCDDTPIAYIEHYNCEDIDPNSCNSRDMYENYLDYSDDRFMNIFTIDQKIRMRTVLENSPRRKSLLTSPALIPPDGIDYDLYARQIIDPPDISCSDNLTPMFIVQNVGSSAIDSFKVSYTLNDKDVHDILVKQSLNPSEIIQVALPSSQVPFGENTIHIVVYEPNDTVDINPGNNTLEKVLIVSNNEELLPSRTRFDQETLDGAGWSVYNPDQSITWELKEYQMNLADDFAAAINLYDYSFIGQEDWLVSPIYDLTNTGELSMFFDYSYASNRNQVDFLDILVSTDCGITFPHLVYSVNSDDLAITDSESEWRPKIPEDWDRDQVILTNFSGNDQVRIGIKTINGNGNVLYLDNIEIFLSENSNPVIPDENSIELYPNPTTTSQFNLAVNLKERDDISISIIDINGKRHFNGTYPNTLNQNFPFDLEGKRAGVYIIKAVGKDFSSIRKLVLIP